jgi:hypothetical protein
MSMISVVPKTQRAHQVRGHRGASLGLANLPPLQSSGSRSPVSGQSGEDLSWRISDAPFCRLRFRAWQLDTPRMQSLLANCACSPISSGCFASELRRQEALLCRRADWYRITRTSPHGPKSRSVRPDALNGFMIDIVLQEEDPLQHLTPSQIEGSR